MSLKLLILVLMLALTMVVFLLMFRGEEEGNVISEVGVVKFINLEGGFYGIVTDDGERYLPLNLPPDYRKDGLRVRFKAKVMENVKTIYMWGKPIKILEIEVEKPP